MPPRLLLVALFVPILLGIVPPKELAESQGVILYFSTELVGILLEKRKYNQYPNTTFRETTHVPQWRHNVSDKKSYTEVHTSDNHQVHHQIFSSYN